MNTIQIYDMLEIPANKNINSFDSCNSYMPGIHKALSGDNPFFQICVRQGRWFLIKKHVINIVLGILSNTSPYFRGSFLKL